MVMYRVIALLVLYCFSQPVFALNLSDETKIFQNNELKPEYRHCARDEDYIYTDVTCGASMAVNKLLKNRIGKIMAEIRTHVECPMIPLPSERISSPIVRCAAQLCEIVPQVIK